MSTQGNAPSRRGVIVAGAAAALAVGVASGAQAQSSTDAAPLRSIMERYAAALRGNDVDTLVSLYTANGVFMRENMPAVVGRDALRAAYRQIFATLKLDLSFDVQEAEIVGDMGWLRAVSKGKIKVLATGVETTDSFNEMIVFRREADGWKIRSCLYASNQPGAQTPK